MDPFLGQIQAFGFNFAPRGWALCNGQLLPIAQNTALFSLLGTTYGGDGRTTFNLPDLRGRVSLHYGSGPGLSTRPIGQKGGAESVTLNTSEIPSHSHTANAAAEAADSGKPSGNALATPDGVMIYRANQAPDATLHSGTIGNTGGNQSHYNMEPFLVINWCIALVGVFPSRN
ncbi:MAG: tail fiber protein [Acidobacteriota bacterium]|nr:tail fiber protein [Acidobacteriota bacterium]